MTAAPCPGAGRKWTGGTGSPMCPICHHGWRALGIAKRPILTPRDRAGTVPAHDRQVAPR